MEYFLGELAEALGYAVVRQDSAEQDKAGEHAQQRKEEQETIRQRVQQLATLDTDALLQRFAHIDTELQENVAQKERLESVARAAIKRVNQCRKWPWSLTTHDVLCETLRDRERDLRQERDEVRQALEIQQQLQLEAELRSEGVLLTGIAPPQSYTLARPTLKVTQIGAEPTAPEAK